MARAQRVGRINLIDAVVQEFNAAYLTRPMTSAEYTRVNTSQKKKNKLIIDRVQETYSTGVKINEVTRNISLLTNTLTPTK
jgi:hypothetical protein